MRWRGEGGCTAAEIFRKSDCKDFRNSEGGWLRYRVWNASEPWEFPLCTFLVLFTVGNHKMEDIIGNVKTLAIDRCVHLSTSTL